MGSSPVTATNVMPPDLVERTLERFFIPLLETPAEAPPTKVLVAFSGGPDSTALLRGLATVAPRLGLDLDATHLDHGLDPDSGRRAARARHLAEEVGVHLYVERLEPTELVNQDGTEAAARHARYRFLDRVADEVGARFIATAHHADDQAETVLLRFAFGSGLEGLRGIFPRRGRLIRPLLELRRHEIQASLEGTGLVPSQDPTNRDVSLRRNRFRQHLLPRLAEQDPRIVGSLGRLAAAAAGAARRLDEFLGSRLAPRPVPHEPGVAVRRAAFETLPEVLLPHALALLHRRAGAPYPAGMEARREFLRQLGTNRGGRAGCDCGQGWRWEASSGLLQLVRSESFAADFAYTVEAPGEVEISELGSMFRLQRGRVAPWMFSACPERAGLAEFSPARDGENRRIEIRNRRPGDRMTPLGSGRRQRLKDLFIERRIPRRQRDRLPILIVDGEIAWVPGVTIAERFRLVPGRAEQAWIAEIEDIQGRGADSSPSGNEEARRICSLYRVDEPLRPSERMKSPVPGR